MNNRIVRLGLAAMAAAALVVVGIVLLTGNDTGAQLSPSSASAVASSPSTGQPATASSIGDGVYLVGTDIPAGLYKGTAVSDALGVWQITGDANGSSTIASDPVISGQFYVQVKKGQYLKLSGVQIVKAAAAPTKMRSSVGDGVYLVGTDIPAGRYRGEPTDWGSWRTSRDANGTQGVHSANEDRGPFYIHVKKGQYLKLVLVKIRRVR